ncbi:MAG TPA: DUF1707 domain-containing protein [Streptosporangiaceae bacterium]|nr:DUF1707 domain-containing protein [Streptosporangiaceae bacterium]
MRASHADRERAIDVLKAAYAEGRLDKDEYAGRTGQVYASSTYAELAALMAGLPAGPLGGRLKRRHGRRQPRSPGARVEVPQRDFAA